jgi:hypothetical protein
LSAEIAAACQEESKIKQQIETCNPDIIMLETPWLILIK